MTNKNIIDFAEHRPMQDIAAFTLYKDCDGKHCLGVTWVNDKLKNSKTTLSQKLGALEEMAFEGLGFLREMQEEHRKEERGIK